MDRKKSAVLFLAFSLMLSTVIYVYSDSIQSTVGVAIRDSSTIWTHARNARSLNSASAVTFNPGDGIISNAQFIALDTTGNIFARRQSANIGAAGADSRNHVSTGLCLGVDTSCRPVNHGLNLGDASGGGNGVPTFNYVWDNINSAVYRMRGSSGNIIEGNTSGVSELNQANNTAGVATSTPYWSFRQTSSPAAGTQATVSQTTTGANRTPVSTFVTACLLVPAAGAAATHSVVLRAGATGAGTIIWTGFIAVDVINKKDCIIAPIPAKGLATTPLTLEFTAAPAANNFQTVTLDGYYTLN